MNVYPGTALDFDGSDDGISTNIDVDPNAYPSMTWEAWVYPTRSNYGDWQFVFSNDDQGWDRTVAIPPNTSFWEVHTGIGPWNAVEIDLDTWQHIAVVFDDNNDSIFFYKNGKRYVYDGLSSFGSSNLKLNIGRSPEDQCYFQGKIDEVRIWDEIRTQQQIRESMHASIACNAAGLISYWNFNEGAGIQLFDAISGNNGTLINMENSDWTNSVIPFGIGFADSQTETNGTVAFTGTGLSMDFTSQNGAEITASRIDINPNLLPVSADIILDDQYWVVNRYDTSSFEADLSFTMAENLTAYDEVNPHTIILYSRPSISDNAWEFSATADSVNAAVNTATFSGITDFSQFIVAKGNPSHITLLTSYMFNSLSGNFNSIDVGQSSSPTFTDLDGDGLLDLIMGEYDGCLNHYEQDAINSVSFSLITASFNGIDVGSSSNPAFTDLNGDGLLDMIIGEGSGNLNHYEQDAINSSSFSLITESFNAIDVGAYSSPTFTDFDGDGLLDLIIGESIGNLNHYEQDAINAGSFSLITTSFNAIDIYNLSNPTFTDLDGDGLLDLIVGEASGNLNHYEQDAIKSGSFSLITTSFNTIDVGYYSIPTFTDLDGDRLLDLIVGESGGNLNHYEQEYIDEMDFGAVLVGNASFAKSYSISAYLVGDLLIECPEGYSISLSESSGYTNSLSIPRAGGSISVQVYVRFSPDSVTSYNGNLVHSSPGATTKNIALSGRGDLIEGFPGTALAFDGEDDYVQLSQVLDIGNVSSTFECWVKVPLVGTNNLDEGERVGILLGNNTNSSSVPSMNYEIHDDGQVRWYWNTGEVEIFGTTDLRDNQWHHLAFVRDKVAEMLTLYIDGAIEKTHDTIGTDLSMNTTQRIGCDNRTTTMPNFHGRIEECRVWNVARSEQQIRESMHLSLIGTESGLAGYWQLNDSAGTQAVDIISGNVGSLVYLDNTDWVASTIPFGTGYADSQTETEGMVAFAGTGLSMDFISQSGAEITAARIDLAPNLNPDGTTVLDEQYWVMNRYDTSLFEADLSFSLAEDLTTEDEYNPSGVVLYTRSSNSDSAWEVKSAAVSVNAAANTATFQGITDFSQFIVGKGSAPLITLMNPYINFLSGNFNSIDVGNYSNPTFTDLDGDGLLDLIIGEMNGNLNHYEQDAVNSSSFSLISPNFNAIDVGGDSSPSFTDLDGDGMLDLIVGEPDGCLYHYEQNAINSLSFTLISPNFNAIDVGDYSIPAFTDLNGDGLLDLIVGEKEGNLYHYEQDAVNSLSFTLINPMFNSIDVGDYSSPAFTDLNWDGLLDLIVGEQGGELYHFEQDTINSGSFSLITASFNAIDVGSCSIPAFTDLDGDGAMDLILGEDGGNLNHYELEIIDEMDFGPVPVGNTIVKMYTLGAKNLLSDLLIECPEGFSISLNESSGYTNSLSISALNGSINEVVYVRFNPDSATSYNGNLQHSSLEARSKNIALSGRGFLIDGFPGKTIDFNGVDEYIQLSSILPVGSISSTFEFWVKVPLVGTNNLEDGERVGVMLSNYSNDPYGPTMTFEIHSQGEMRIYWELPEGGSFGAHGNTDLRDNQWHHLAYVRDKVADKIFFYVDGKLDYTHPTAWPDITINTVHRIGRDNRPSNPPWFHGNIEEIRGWNLVRTQEEIKESMHLPLTGLESGLMYYWQFNEDDGPQVVDAISGNNGTIINIERITSTIPFGTGFANSQTETTGIVDFAGTGLSMDFASQSGAEITAARINLAPNLPPEATTDFDNQYWVVNRYGGDSFSADLTFALSEDLTVEDENDPSKIWLYTRESTSDLEWTLAASATSVNALDNEVTFQEITSFGQFILGSSKMELDLKVFFEGPFNGIDMNTDLIGSQELPLNQPYSILPWNYQGTDSVITFPNSDIVDWILVELRDAPDAGAAITAPYIARQAAFILKDGSVVAMDGSVNPRLDISINEQLFVVVWHRNHLGIMSTIPLAESGGIYSFDFSSANSQAYGTGSQKDLGSGVFGMIAGDANGDGIINDTDKNPVWYTQAGIAGYLSADLNMDRQCDNQDKDDYWFPNQGYESEVSFTYGPCPGVPTLTFAGQTYNTVQIGDQCWIKENLNVGTMIQELKEMTNNDTIEKYCYDNNPANCDEYGGLYQWDEMMQYTTLEGAQGICPEGWHIPTNGEWGMLTYFLGGNDIAGGKMKEVGTLHWYTPNTGATNENGFTALPGGTLDEINGFHAMGTYCRLWSSSEFNGSEAGDRHINYSGISCNVWVTPKIYPLSVRCIKDN